MHRVLMTAFATAALSLAAAPAYSAVVVVGPTTTTGVTSCLSFTFASPATEIACAGGYTIPNGNGNGAQGNLLSGSPITGIGLQAIQALGYTGTGAFASTDKIDIANGGTTLNFNNQVMSGLTIIGIHYGGAGDVGGEATSFFSLLVPAGTTSITVSGRTLGGANSLGLSNAVLFSTGGPVPEPATWAMMLLGFGGIGLAMRRRRRATALSQVA